LYHWAMQRLDGLTSIGDDRVMVFEAGGAAMLFALGPPTPTLSSDARMRRLLGDLGDRVDAIRWCEQIHGRIVASVAAEPGWPFKQVACVGRCDALMTASRRLGLAAWSADCVPILLVGDGVIAAVHSGWRGAAADITGAVVRQFEVEFGVPSDRLHAALGPAISGPRYEVGNEVIDSLRVIDVDEGQWLSGNHVDLRGFLRSRLEILGLDAKNVHLVGPCTASTPELASYRRDGQEAGRQWSMIYRFA